MHRVDRFRFIDLTDLEDDPDEEDEMKPWPSAEAIADALAPVFAEAEAALRVAAVDLDTAASVVSAGLLTSRGRDYFPTVQLEKPCRLLLEVTMAREAADPDVFSTEFSHVIVGLGLARAPDPKHVEAAQKVLEKALAALSGLKDEAEDE
jgi:hypothetical protein